MHRLDVSAEAELEIFEAALRYERERSGLGFRFEAQVGAVFARLLDIIALTCLGLRHSALFSHPSSASITSSWPDVDPTSRSCWVRRAVVSLDDGPPAKQGLARVETEANRRRKPANNRTMAMPRTIVTLSPSCLRCSASPCFAVSSVNSVLCILGLSSKHQPFSARVFSGNRSSIATDRDRIPCSTL